MNLSGEEALEEFEENYNKTTDLTKKHRLEDIGRW